MTPENMAICGHRHISPHWQKRDLLCLSSSCLQALSMLSPKYGIALPNFGWETYWLYKLSSASLLPGTLTQGHTALPSSNHLPLPSAPEAFAGPTWCLHMSFLGPASPSSLFSALHPALQHLEKAGCSVPVCHFKFSSSPSVGADAGSSKRT